MNKYINILKKYYTRDENLNLSFFEDSYFCDDIILATDIDFSYYDDYIICDKKFLDDIYLDDTLYYID